MAPQSSGSTQDTRTQTAALAQQNLSPPDTQQRPLTSPPAPSSKMLTKACDSPFVTITAVSLHRNIIIQCPNN